MNKLKKFTPRQAQIGFTTKESWNQVRTKVKDSKCENCGKLHSECSGEIALVLFTDHGNAHVCESCAKMFIENGAVDINKSRANNEVIKIKLIKQAERLGFQFNTYWNKKKSEDYSTKELKELIKRLIRSERDQFKMYLKYPHRAILKEFVDAHNSQDSKYNIMYFEAFKTTPDVLYDHDTDDNYDHHRWCSYFDATLKLGGKTFAYTWANANGDNDLEDAGFDVSNVWESMSVVEPDLSIPGQDIAIEFGKYLVDKAFNDSNVEWNFNEFLKDK